MIVETLRADMGIFLTDNAAEDVAITPPVAGVARAYINGQLLPYYFQPADNFIIHAISVDLPFAFISGSVPFSISLVGQDSAGATFALANFGGGGQLHIHSENVFIDMNEYFAFSLCPSMLKWRILGLVLTGRISCVNAPAVLNAKTYHLYSNIRISHTIPLIV